MTIRTIAEQLEDMREERDEYLSRVANKKADILEKIEYIGKPCVASANVHSMHGYRKGTLCPKEQNLLPVISMIFIDHQKWMMDLFEYLVVSDEHKGFTSYDDLLVAIDQVQQKFQAAFLKAVRNAYEFEEAREKGEFTKDYAEKEEQMRQLRESKKFEGEV